MIKSDEESVAKKNFVIIGSKLQLENEDEPPFSHLHPIVDFNGVDIKQSKTHIRISCENYIDRMMHCNQDFISSTKNYINQSRAKKTVKKLNNS